ncbi:MAG: VPS10 domain-containing protein, partial [Saprospiraceae bacterium]
MNNIFKLVLLGALLTAWASCRPAQQLSESANEKIREKTEPYDLFAFQRSYPDTSFDWQAWRRALEVTRRQEAVVSRNSVDCFSGGTDWTQEGPGNVAGRLNSLAMHPQNENYVLAGFSGGGIFKTTDGGANWTPVFDEQPELSIGDITFDPNNPNIVYAGTGDPNVPSNVFNGNGIYKSADAGNTWSYLALQNQGIISKVVVDPANSQTLYAAAMGNPYVRDSLRGIYKSSDGGQNWERVLFVHPQAGASDLVINHQNPQILYAAFWDRIRSNKESIVFGPHARIYKTTDGGATWTQLTGGLPTGIMGRTGLAISAQNPDKLYAIYVDTLSRPGGMFKTTDGGANWTPVNISTLSDAFGDFGWFFGKVRCNTYNDEDLYLLGVLLWRRQPGSNAWQVGAGAHADTHDLLFAPSGKRYLATDGGMYTNITGIAWTKSK